MPKCNIGVQPIADHIDLARLDMELLADVLKHECGRLPDRQRLALRRGPTCIVLLIQPDIIIFTSLYIVYISLK